MTLYDEVPYPSQVFAQTHPDRLATIARLYGLDPAPPERCRMLDLGCGDGLNVISCALAAPDSEFVGVDLASVAIAHGREIAEKVGAKNVRLLVGDVSAPDPSWGTFDYVVSHGVYSWVPAPVRERLLATLAASLGPRGVGYVSYIAYPGSFAQSMFREVMLHHTRNAPAGVDPARRSIELLRLLAAARPKQGDPWGDWLSHEINFRAEASPEYLRHDDLAEVRDPVWWYQFAEHAARHGLRYLGEADWTENTDVGLVPEVRAVVHGIEDPVVREQYRDIIKFRRFRQTLLVHASATPTREPRTEPVADLFVAGEVRPPEASVPLDRKETEQFVGPRGSRAATDAPIARAALRVLGERWPARTSFADLFAESYRRVAEARAAAGAAPAPEEEREHQRETLVTIVAALHDAGVVLLHSVVPVYAQTAGERPVTSPLARVMLQKGNRVASLLHLNIELKDARSQRLVAMLDGTLDRPEILRRMIAAESPPNDPPLPGEPPLTKELLDTTLSELARRALLSA